MTSHGPAEGAGADQHNVGIFNRETAAGIFLLVLAGIGFFGGLNLEFGSLRSVGSGLVPRSVAILLAAFGVLTIVQGVLGQHERLEKISFRSIFFVLGAVLIFAATIRTAGMVVATPAAVLFSSLADRETRLTEIIPFTIVLTLFCVGLFKYLLSLPIPLMPPLLGY